MKLYVKLLTVVVLHKLLLIIFSEDACKITHSGKFTDTCLMFFLFKTSFNKVIIPNIFL